MFILTTAEWQSVKINLADVTDCYRVLATTESYDVAHSALRKLRSHLTDLTNTLGMADACQPIRLKVFRKVSVPNEVLECGRAEGDCRKGCVCVRPAHGGRAGDVRH